MDKDDEPVTGLTPCDLCGMPTPVATPVYSLVPDSSIPTTRTMTACAVCQPAAPNTSVNSSSSTAPGPSPRKSCGRARSPVPCAHSRTLTRRSWPM